MKSISDYSTICFGGAEEHPFESANDGLDWNKIILSPTEERVASGRDFIGPFQILRMIRSGNTTTVFEAMRTGGGADRVALKVLLDRFKKDRGKIEELRHEANVGKNLKHPNVITIFEFSNQYSLPFISMQLFNARNLKQELREKPDRLHANLEEIISRCCLGLQHLHSQGWIHCDVKPDNFLVDERANVKLIDFSIAKKTKTGLAAFFSRSRVLQGTRSYMAPEQIRRKPVTPATDIYGLACVIFEMLAGKPPYTGVNPDEVLNKHLRAPLPSIQASNKTVSDNFAQLLAQMLSKNPEKRPQSIESFLTAYKALNSRVYRAGMRPTYQED